MTTLKILPHGSQRITHLYIKPMTSNQPKTLAQLKEDLEKERPEQELQPKRMLNSDLVVYKLLFPMVAHKMWSNHYDAVGSNVGIKDLIDMEVIWLAYRNLLQRSPELRMDFIPFEVSARFTEAVYTLFYVKGKRIIDVPFDQSEDAVYKAKRLINNLPKRFLGVINSQELLHFTFYMLDFKKEKLISFESLGEAFRMDEHYAEYYMTMHASLKARIQHTKLKPIRNVTLYNPSVSQQSDNDNCMFYSFFNAKFASRKIITKFRNREIYQLKFMMLLELLRGQLFPILVDN
ncbi:hypothetical protein SNEBB_003796 [Seison nebaliae]|nr:hypothetical protein SNEBB_003796 [Seison nebaliae]